jgi:hypothetical protein
VHKRSNEIFFFSPRLPVPQSPRLVLEWR